MSDLPELHRIPKKNNPKICYFCHQDLEQFENYNYYFDDEYYEAHMRCWRVYVKENKGRTHKIRCAKCGTILEIDEQGKVWSSYRVEIKTCWICGNRW